MQIDFEGVAHSLQDGAVTGIVGDNNSGVRPLLRACGGLYIGAGDPLDLSPAPLVVISYAFDVLDAASRLNSEAELETLRRAGTTVVLASHDSALLGSVADEVWWLLNGKVQKKGDPREVLAEYARHSANRVRAAASGQSTPVAPSLRRGDGRAELISIETLGADSELSSSWHSGEPVAIRVTVHFHAAVENPVVGIMIRTRIGMEVYGTNTELENVRVGPCACGDLRTVRFEFACNLCPQYYTITAASHDPDGVWHDWLEDAVAVTVSDERYTAGVANLRATVKVSGSRE